MRAWPAAAERAGLAYFAVVFAAGFAFGTFRVLFVEERLGPEFAVAAELPLMLAISWVVAGRLVARFAVPEGSPRLRMGFLALVLLVLAETALASTFGTGVSQHMAGYATARGALTLAGQLGFALMPLLAGRR